MNLGLFQRDTNVVWDLAPHDFSILLYLVKERPHTVRAIGTKTVVHRSQKQAQESTAHIVLSYKSGLAVHIHVSWTSPVKTRQITVVGSERMALYNQMAPHQLLLLDQGVYPNQTEGDTGPLFNYKIGETTEVPYDTSGEDLLRMLKDFGNAVITGTEPRSHARLALQTVALLAATERSIKNGGTPVTIEYEKKNLVESLFSFTGK
jgi:predicted dehydrogenase